MVNLQDDLVDYYRREMSYLRESGDHFAQRYPKVAQRLSFNRQITSCVEQPKQVQKQRGLKSLGIQMNAIANRKVNTTKSVK